MATFSHQCHRPHPFLFFREVEIFQFLFQRLDGSEDIALGPFMKCLALVAPPGVVRFGDLLFRKKRLNPPQDHHCSHTVTNRLLPVAPVSGGLSEV